MRNFARRARRARRLGVTRAVVGYLAARRALLPFLAAAVYVVGVDVRVSRERGGLAWFFGIITLVTCFVASGPSLPGNGLRDDGRRQVGLLAFALMAAGLALSTVGSHERDLAQDLAGAVIACLASSVVALALARIPEGHGIATSLPRPGRGQLGATLLMLGVAFGVALASSIRSMRVPDAADSSQLARDVHAVACGAALVILLGSAWETSRVRRLVLGTADRSIVALGVLAAAVASASGLLVLGEWAPDRLLRMTVALVATATTYACLFGDAATLTRLGRRAATLLLFGGPLVLLGGLAAEGPGRSVLPLLVTGAISLGVGSAIGYLEQPLRRAEGRLLDAVESAHRALVRADPETSVRDAMGALRGFAGPSTQSPELWTLTPERVLTIDGAGYPHDREASLPSLLLDVARGEPEATVRTDLLEALVVRRPDLRPLCRWMDERGALSATLVMREGEVEGVLVLPRGDRRVTLALEEVRAVKRLADAFAGAAAARAALERSLARETAASARALEAEEKLAARTRRDDLEVGRDALATARLAADAGGGPYAPAARLAFESIERHVHRGLPIVIVTPGGADVIPYLARAHLSGGRATAPFVAVDGSSARHRDAATWRERLSSPLALAEGGLLVLEHALRLPLDVRTTIANVLLERRAPWEDAGTTSPFHVAVALTTEVLPERPSADARPDDPLSTLLEAPLTHPIEWPPLRERGEDLRSLVLAGLTREGMRTRGAPIGIEDGAYEALANYGFPGEETELRAILTRLARLASGDVVRRADVNSLRLGGDERA